MRNIVITGANRGLGLEFVRQWSAGGDAVYALCRDPSRADELHAIAADRVSVLPCNVQDDRSVQDAAQAVLAAIDHVDLLVNNAGTFGQRGGALAAVDLDDVRRVHEVNTLGPLRVTRAFKPLLERAHGAKIVHVTSRMGSIADNSSGTAWGYRMSKAALNMACVNMAHEFDPERLTTFVIHPGWVRTDMGGGAAPLGIEEAVTAMRETIDRADASAHGTFVDLHGEPIPW